MRRPLNLNHWGEKWQRKPLSLCSRHTQEAFELRGGAWLKCQSELWMSSRLPLMLESKTFRGHVTRLHQAPNVGVCVVLSKSFWLSRCENWQLSFWISADWKVLFIKFIFRDLNAVFVCTKGRKANNFFLFGGLCGHRLKSVTVFLPLNSSDIITFDISFLKVSFFPTTWQQLNDFLMFDDLFLWGSWSKIWCNVHLCLGPGLCLLLSFSVTPHPSFSLCVASPPGTWRSLSRSTLTLITFHHKGLTVLSSGLFLLRVGPFQLG